MRAPGGGRVSRGSVMVDIVRARSPGEVHLARGGSGQRRRNEAADQMQRHVDAGGNARRRDDPALFDPARPVDHLQRRKRRREFGLVLPVRGDRPAL